MTWAFSAFGHSRVTAPGHRKQIAMAKQSAPRSIIRDVDRPKFFAVLIRGQDDREDIRIFKSRRSAELLFFKVATGILKGESFFDAAGGLVPLQSSYMYGVFSNDLEIVRRSIDEYNAIRIYCSIPESGGHDISIDNLFGNLH